MITTARGPGDSFSLPEVNATVPTSQLSLWKRLFAFAGPAYLVSVGYMDPGNWATDLEGGARFGYQLIWVLLMSNAMAILLQTLSARLGIVSRRDLAQACRESYPKPVSYALWLLCEVAIAACDLAEVIGAAIGLNLLFHIPLMIGVLITAADTLLLLWFTRLGIRVIEGIVLGMIAIIGLCFAVEILLARPHAADILSGFLPHLNGQSLYVAIGILGATVMPHNLYLHSALVQTRRIGKDDIAKREACKFNLIDSAVALNLAFLVNAAILILSATVFFRRGIVVTEIQQAHVLLAPLLGTSFASGLFAIALLSSGQSSTLTGTMAGQIVMEGFLNIRMRPWLRRLVTRLLAIIPAAITLWVAGDQGIYQLLLLSQVILSFQLPFAVIPLLHFTNDRQRMGSFASRAWLRILGWIVAAIIVALNVWLIFRIISEWVGATPAHRTLILTLVLPIAAALAGLLLWITLDPVFPAWVRRWWSAGPFQIEPAATNLQSPVYRSILVPLDHSTRDRVAIAHAAALARANGAKIYLLHVEEDVTSQIYGPMASTAEVEAGSRYLDDLVHSLKEQDIPVEAFVRYSNHPREEIVGMARQLHPDLLVMGAHGHKGLKDMIFGTTINAVRHDLDVPILVVREQGQ
jgi:manganese transport protein